MNVTFSSFDNSNITCDSSITNALVCADYQECYSTSLDTNNAPICCTSYEACLEALNISATIPFNSSAINNISIRCDGYYSCSDVTGIIYSKNGGGDMYFTGAFSGSYTMIKNDNNNNHNIICTGAVSCGHTTLIQNALNLYCMGFYSCLRADSIQYIGNVYGYGGESLRESNISDILDSVYCGGYRSCYQSSITNVNDTVYGSGYQVLYEAVINNVTNL